MSGGGREVTGSTATTDGNLIVHGDNLHALKALLPTYAGRVKCIYIDPPYNTGSQSWVFNDNVNSDLMRQWIGDNKPVDGEDLERHDKWLCMMWPRLQLLKELLAYDGVIFASIDDHEQHHLRSIMDEIFGSNCFGTCVAAVVNLKGSRDNRGFTNSHEYILVYEKSPNGSNLNELRLSTDEMEDWEEDETGWFKIGANLKYSGENAARSKRPNLFYPLYVTANAEVGTSRQSATDVELWPLTSTGQEVTWRWSKRRVEAQTTEVVARRVSTGWSVHKKQRPPVGTIPTRKPKSTLYSPHYSSTTATGQVKDAFDGQRVFDYPKSSSLIADLIRIGDVNGNDIVLDSFAGSGTTAHAVLALNKEDGGNRKFILVECEDYADTITAERVRRVIRGVPSAKDAALREGLGGEFTYCELGDAMTVEGMLTGDSMPAFDQLATYLINCATGAPVAPGDLITPHNAEFDDDTAFVYETADHRFHLFYRPDMEWLRSNNGEGALNEDRAKQISQDAKSAGKTAIVFGPVRYMNTSDLRALGITFCQLPYALTSANSLSG